MRRRRILITTPLMAAVAVAVGLAVVPSGTSPSGSPLSFTFGDESADLRAEPAVLRRRIISPEFDPPLAVRAGRVVFARGPIACDPGEVFTVEVTITQGEASGRGRTAGACTGEEQQWTVVVAARGGGTFGAGPADACGVATTRRAGITDTFEWCAQPVLAPTGAGG